MAKPFQLHHVIPPLLLGLVLGLYQATTSSFLPSPWSAFLPVIGVLAYFISTERRGQAILFAASAGLVLDLFSLSSGASSTVRGPLLALALAFISEHVLTNHSLYAVVALSLLGRTIDWLSLASIQFALHLTGVEAFLAPGWSMFWRTAMLDMVFVAFLFLLGVLFRRRFVTTPRSAARSGYGR